MSDQLSKKLKQEKITDSKHLLFTGTYLTLLKMYFVGKLEK